MRERTPDMLDTWTKFSLISERFFDWNIPRILLGAFVMNLAAVKGPSQKRKKNVIIPSRRKTFSQKGPDGFDPLSYVFGGSTSLLFFSYQILYSVSVPLCGQWHSLLEPLCHCLAERLHGQPAAPWGYVHPLETTLLLEPIQLRMCQLPTIKWPSKPINHLGTHDLEGG